MKRQFGASTFIWSSPFTDNDLDLVAHVATLGFEVFEVCVEDPNLLTASKLAQAAKDHGIEVSVCGAFSPDRDASVLSSRAVALDYLKRCIEFAAETGSPHVAGPMYAGTGTTQLVSPSERDAQRNRSAETLREAALFAQDAGVTLAIEPLNRYETDLVNTVDQGLELCDLIGTSNVGLMLDTYHMNIEETSIGAAIERAGNRCFHVQASENDRGTPGAGHIPWVEFQTALNTIGYTGSIVIESFIPTNKTIARAVSLWRPVASSPDALASDGIAFLRELEKRVTS